MMQYTPSAQPGQPVLNPMVFLLFITGSVPWTSSFSGLHGSPETLTGKRKAWQTSDDLPSFQHSSVIRRFFSASFRHFFSAYLLHKGKLLCTSLPPSARLGKTLLRPSSRYQPEPLSYRWRPPFPPLPYFYLPELVWRRRLHWSSVTFPVSLTLG